MQIGSSNDKAEINIHGGGINGFRTLITRIPKTKSSIIILANLESVPVYEMTNSILGILHGKPYDKNISIAYTLVDVVAKKGIKKGIEFYQEIKDNSDYYKDVNEMNIAGYELLHSGETKQALAIFKLNIDAFPNSFIPYDSYAETLLLIGEKAEAIEYYKKSVALNPNNKNAVETLNSITDINK